MSTICSTTLRTWACATDYEHAIIISPWCYGPFISCVVRVQLAEILRRNNCLQIWVSWFQAFAVFGMLYAFFWVIIRRLEFICRRFGTLCLFHLHRQVEVSTYLPICLWRWSRQSVPKSRHINSRSRGITQKKAYNITVFLEVIRKSELLNL